MSKFLRDLKISLDTMNELIYDRVFDFKPMIINDNEKCLLIQKKKKQLDQFAAQYLHYYSPFEDEFIKIRYFKNEDNFIVQSTWPFSKINIMQLEKSLSKRNFMYKKCEIKWIRKGKAFSLTHIIKNSKANRERISRLIDFYLNLKENVYV